MSASPTSPQTPPTRRRARVLGGALLVGLCALGATACGDFQLAEFTRATTTTVEVEAAEGADLVPETTTTTLRPARYTIQAGENLGDIAARFGVTVDSLMLRNGISDANTVQAGTIIVIPDPDAPVTPPWQLGQSLAVG